MAKSRRADASDEKSATADVPSLRERVEVVLFIVVEVLCLLLFIDFLFLGIYVK